MRKTRKKEANKGNKKYMSPSEWKKIADNLHKYGNTSAGTSRDCSTLF